MAKKGGLTPLWSDKEVERWFNYHIDRAEEKMYILMQRAGEEFVKIARERVSIMIIQVIFALP